MSRTAPIAIVRKPLLRLAIAHVLSLALLVSLIFPHHAVASEVARSHAAISVAAEAAQASGHTSEGGVLHVSCASCACQLGTLSHVQSFGRAICLDGSPAYTIADRLPPPLPAALPFKPPRA